MRQTAPSPALRDARLHSAMLGTAVGDALGDPTEFVRDRAELDRRWPGGIRTLEGRPPQFTDDTQMTLFTAESLVVAATVDRVDLAAMASHDLLVRRALEAQLRWRETQGRSAAAEYGPVPGEGSLAAEPAMRHVKAPGLTCLGALDAQHARYAGAGPVSFEHNDSKGCGGVMRVAPYGLVLDDPWAIAADNARLTHGHPLGWLTASVYATLVRDLLQRSSDEQPGDACARSLTASLQRLEGTDAHTELARLLDAALTHPREATVPHVLGEGWIAEEALAIGLWCALAFDDPIDALAASATHPGDTDSTAAITGCLLGVLHGDASVFDPLEPDRIEGIELVSAMAERLIELRASEPVAPQLPVARSWWIEPGRVLGGMFAADRTTEGSCQRLGALLDAGVRLFVNLQEPGERGHGGEPFPDYEPLLHELAAERGASVRVHRLPVPDMGVPRDPRGVELALDVIDAAIADGELVYVHCWGGHGRTGTIAGCLLRRRGASAEHAFEHIARARAHDSHLAGYPSPQTSAQRSFVEEW